MSLTITPRPFSRPIFLICTDAHGYPVPGTELYFFVLIFVIHSFHLNKVYFLNLLQSSAQTYVFVTLGLFVYTFLNLLKILNLLWRIWYKENKRGVSVTLDFKLYVGYILIKF